MQAAMWCLIVMSLSLALQAKNSKQEPLFLEISDYEKELFLIPAGKYTLEDIQANGKMTRSQKFKDFISAHNPQPKQGDFICPITSVKASPSCTWIINGKSYQFCCPSCIDEFLSLAKTSPEKIQDPEYYIQSK